MDSRRHRGRACAGAPYRPRFRPITGGLRDHGLRRQKASVASAHGHSRANRLHGLRCERSGQQIPADRAATSAEGRTQCPDHPDRRRRVWLGERVRGPLPDAERGETGGSRSEIQSLSHHRSLLAKPPGPFDRAQSPFLRHGRHHRNRHRGTWIQFHSAQHDFTAGADAQAQRLLDGAVRQMPRSAGVGDKSNRALRRVANRRRRFRVFLRFHRAARRTSGIRPFTRARRRSSRRRRPKRAIISWKT